VTWAAVGHDEAAQNWDRDLGRLPGQSMAQSFGWGCYKASQGWRPLRWVARDANGVLVAMAQVLVRVYAWRTVLAWCPGGLAGPITHWNPDLFGQIARATRARRLYCRAAFTRSRSDADVTCLRSHGWTRPRRIVGAPHTMVWDMPDTDDALLAGLGRSWRHNLRRAWKRNLRVVEWVDPSPAILAQLFDAMARYKTVDSYFDAPALTALLRCLDGHVYMYGCADDTGVPLAVRACAVQHRSAWDLLAATSPEGRRCYASYAVLWALIQRCRADGVTQYDLSGVDAVGAVGVYNFKKGTGAREVECLGEWERATSPPLAHVVNLAIRFRRRAALP
jgi:hypothetical protein